MCSNTTDIPVLSMCINGKYLIHINICIITLFYSQQYLASMIVKMS